MKLAGQSGELRRALEAAANARELFCFLDYDGTLAPIAPRPELAKPLPGMETILARLVRLPHTSVAVVSGRKVADLVSFLPIDGLFYVGLHGAEFRTPEGQLLRAPIPPEAEELLQHWRGKLESLATLFPGVWIEDKGAALACHYRQAGAETVRQLGQLLEEFAAALQAPSVPIEILHGNCVWELRPKGIDKGRAVLWLLRTYRPAALPLYAGDDQTDEDAFAQLPEEAITIRVGLLDVPSKARYRVISPHELAEFLGMLAQRREQRAAVLAPPPHGNSQTRT